MTFELDNVFCECGHPASHHEPDMDGYASEYCQELDCECEGFKLEREKVQ